MKRKPETFQIKKVYDSGIFDQMIGTREKNDVPPLILRKFFTGDIDFIKNKLAKNRMTLEVGCGYGRLLKPLSAISKKVIGIDCSEFQIRRSAKLAKRLNNVKTRLMRAEKMNFRNNSFDCALCLNNSLGNMPRIETQVIKEMQRTVKNGGQVIVRVFANTNKVRIAQYKNYERLGFTGIKDSERAVTTNEGFYSRRFTKKDLREIFNSAGLDPTIKKDGKAGYIAEATK